MPAPLDTPDSTQITLTFSRDVVVKGKPVRLTRSLNIPLAEYNAMTPKEIDDVKDAKIAKYVDVQE